MKSKHNLHRLALAALTCLAAGSALAEQDSGYGYWGLGVGESRSDFDEQGMATRLLAPGATTATLNKDQRGLAYKLFGGYQINRNFALEAGYFNLGKFGFSSTTLPAGTFGSSIKVQGLNLDLVGTLPLTERLSMLGRVGAQYARTNDSFNGTGAAAVATQSRSARATNAKYGAGLQYEVSPSFLMRGELERYRIADGIGGHGNVNVATVSLVFPFDRETKPMPRPMAAAYVAPAPAPVVAPAPPPVIAAAPVAPVIAPPVRRRVSFNAESLFAFDKAVLRPEGQAALDAFTRELAGSQYETINVEGHTDRLGSQAYNQRLSVQRAEAVKAYLADAGRINAAKISAVGKGETSPKTQPGDCKGNKANPKLIACLQPDRRVEIEVVGTR